jgi:hypothetical protein
VEKKVLSLIHLLRSLRSHSGPSASSFYWEKALDEVTDRMFGILTIQICYSFWVSLEGRSHLLLWFQPSESEGFV